MNRHNAFHWNETVLAFKDLTTSLYIYITYISSSSVNIKQDRMDQINEIILKVGTDS